MSKRKMKHYKRSLLLLLLLLLLFERVFIRFGHGSVVEKSREVNGEIGSVNAGGVNRLHGYGRSTWLWEVYSQKLNYLF